MLAAAENLLLPRFIPGDENSIFNYGLHIGGYLPSHQKAAYPVSIPDLDISFESYALPPNERDFVTMPVLSQRPVSLVLGQLKLFDSNWGGRQYHCTDNAGRQIVDSRTMWTVGVNGGHLPPNS